MLIQVEGRAISNFKSQSHHGSGGCVCCVAKIEQNYFFPCFYGLTAVGDLHPSYSLWQDEEKWKGKSVKTCRLR